MTFFDEGGNRISGQEWLATYEPYHFLDSNGPKLGRRINARNQSSHFVEDRACSLLTKTTALSADDLILIMAWKLGLIDHSQSEIKRDIVYRQEWPSTLTARLQFNTLDFSASIPAVAARMQGIREQDKPK